MRFYYDLEFLEDGKTIELISIGIVREDGLEYYAVNKQMPVRRIVAHEWLMRNVWPQLPLLLFNPSVLDREFKDWKLSDIGYIDTSDSSLRSRAHIAAEVEGFLLSGGDDPELWAWCGAYDHVCLNQLWGSMMSSPKGLPHFSHDIAQEHRRLGRPELPSIEGDRHNALSDARYNKSIREFLEEYALCSWP
jgi:hypothetical protein